MTGHPKPIPAAVTARESELLPCPFCGGKAEVRRRDWPYMRFWARCLGCLLKTGERNTYEKAVAAWNTRPAPALVGDVEGVREALECGLEWVIDAANNTKGIELENAMRDIARIEAVLASLRAEEAK